MKKSLIIEILADVSSFVTITAAIPYELGDAAQYLSPEMKMLLVKIGIFSTLALRIIKIITVHLEKSNTPNP